MTRRRFDELDFLRGLCLLVMIIWHLAWDLKVFYGYPFRPDQGWMYWSARVIVITFLVLAGISSYLTGNQQKRAFRVLFFAMVITVFTFFYDREQVILFGILHCMGVNMLFYPYYRRLNPWLLAGIAVTVISLGDYVASIGMPVDILLPLGLRSASYRSLDYFPLIPYAGYFMLGALLGPILYPHRRARLNIFIPDNPVSYMGRHSLTVYVLHQPVLVSLLFILKIFELI